MQMRKATFDDVEDMLEIYEEARAALKAQGVDQWQDGYPSRADIEMDIENSESYVFVKSEGIVAVALVSFEGEEDYDEIEGGEWRRNEPFAVIHRVAVSSVAKGQGVAVEMMAHIEMLADRENVAYLRIDTHRDNMPMQRLLAKTGFVHCGTIFLQGVHDAHHLRLAYDKVL